MASSLTVEYSAINNPQMKTGNDNSINTVQSVGYPFHVWYDYYVTLTVQYPVSKPLTHVVMVRFETWSSHLFLTIMVSHEWVEGSQLHPACAELRVCGPSETTYISTYQWYTKQLEIKNTCEEDKKKPIWNHVL